MLIWTVNMLSMMTDSKNVTIVIKYDVLYTLLIAISTFDFGAF